MSTYQWASPYGYQKIGPKQFGISLTASRGLSDVLQMTSGALAELNNGTLWRHDGSLLRRPDVCAEALELSATAFYRRGRIYLQAVVQPSLDRRQVGLTLTFQDSGNGYGMNWMDQVSEVMTATTVLHVGESIYCRFTGQPSRQNPCLRWTILQGAWHSGGLVNYAGWTIELPQ